MDIKYDNDETVEVPLDLLKDLAEIAFDYANPEAEKYHGLPLIGKHIAMKAENAASEIIKDAAKVSS